MYPSPGYNNDDDDGSDFSDCANEGSCKCGDNGQDNKPQAESSSAVVAVTSLLDPHEVPRPPPEASLPTAVPADPITNNTGSEAPCFPSTSDLPAASDKVAGAATSDAAPQKAAPEVTPIEKAIVLAREIRRERAYVGYSAFVVFALMTKTRVFIWEGENRIDLMATFAPWAAEFCDRDAIGDAIVCTYASAKNGESVCHHVSEEHPLNAINHYIVGVRGHGEMHGESQNTITSFYLARGVIPLGTVADGDCGIDTMCYLRGSPQTPQSRLELRIALSDFLLKHAEHHGLQHALGCCQEVAEVAPDAIDTIRRDEEGNQAEAQGSNDTANKQPDIDANVLAAVKWASGLAKADAETVAILASGLPTWCIHEQVERYKRHLAESQALVGAQKQKDALAKQYTQTLLRSRRAAALDMQTFFRGRGWDPHGKNLPRGAFEAYWEARPKLKVQIKDKRSKDKLRRFYQRALKTMGTEGKVVPYEDSKAMPRQSTAARFVRDYVRRRARGTQGRGKKAPIVRTLLFEWFSILRHSIDTKVMSRFPPKLVELKAKQLVSEYVQESLKAGVQPNPPSITSHWISEWAAEYRVSFRVPNRKFKVPKWVLEQRLIIFWVNTFRIRTLAVAVLGYDLEFDDVDQSPFHVNESGSKNSLTLSIKGAPTVPVKEGHAATRSRWSANTMTTSSEERAAKIPPLECMFKASGDQLERKLQHYIRGRGDWLTVVTGPKGSYREEHILNYLEKHLDDWTEDRHWRVLLLDAYAPQMTDNVRRLCWSKGYVVLIHGGGSTGVMQPNDTDLHQHLRREYIDKETSYMVMQSRIEPGRTIVPRPENCIDWIASIWQRPELHLKAQKGFKRTGITCHLDGIEDQEIVREAGEFWKTLGMARRRDQAKVDVEVEVQAGRLSWTYDSVYSLVTSFPRTGILDQTQEFQDDEIVACEADEQPWDNEAEAPHPIKDDHDADEEDAEDDADEE